LANVQPDRTEWVGYEKRTDDDLGRRTVHPTWLFLFWCHPRAQGLKNQGVHDEVRQCQFDVGKARLANPALGQTTVFRLATHQSCQRRTPAESTAKADSIKTGREGD